MRSQSRSLSFAWTPLLTCPLVCNNRCWVLIVLGRALCTITGPGFDPGVSTPRCSTTRINCMLIVVLEKHTCHIPSSVPPPPHSRLRQVDAFVDFSCFAVVDMLVHGEHAAAEETATAPSVASTRANRHHGLGGSHGDPRQPGPRWSARRTTCHGTRRLHLRGRGRRLRLR